MNGDLVLRLYAQVRGLQNYVDFFSINKSPGQNELIFTNILNNAGQKLVC